LEGGGGDSSEGRRIIYQANGKSGKAYYFKQPFKSEGQKNEGIRGEAVNIITGGRRKRGRALKRVEAISNMKRTIKGKREISERRKFMDQLEVGAGGGEPMRSSEQNLTA